MYIHKDGEIWHMSSSPGSPDVMATCYNRSKIKLCEQWAFCMGRRGGCVGVYFCVCAGFSFLISDTKSYLFNFMYSDNMRCIEWETEKCGFFYLQWKGAPWWDEWKELHFAFLMYSPEIKYKMTSLPTSVSISTKILLGGGDKCREAGKSKNWVQQIDILPF